MLSQTLLPFALVALTTTVSATGHLSPLPQRRSAHHWSRNLLPGRPSTRASRRAAAAAPLSRRGSASASSPSNLSDGSLTAAEGCTEWYRVASGDSCYSAIAAAATDVSLDQFFAMNPQVNGECHNLWAGYDYCVARATGSTKKTVKNVVEKVASTKAATTAAPTSTAAAVEDDEDCDTDDVEEETTTAAAAKQTKAQVKAQVAATTTTTQAAAAATTTAAAAKQNVVSNAVSKAGVTSFLGVNSGIGSWFHTNLASDSTNGNSWCGCPYTDATPGFAPSVGTMLANFGGDYRAAGTAYCGLEAKFTAPDGSTSTLYIADGFDDKWVLSPGSVDIVYDSFAPLFGKTTTNKNDVIQGLKWEFTGNRRADLGFEACR